MRPRPSTGHHAPATAPSTDASDPPFPPSDPFLRVLVRAFRIRRCSGRGVAARRSGGLGDSYRRQRARVSVRVSLSLMDFERSADGRTELRPLGSSPRSCRGRVTVGPLFTQLQSHEERRLEVRVEHESTACWQMLVVEASRTAAPGGRIGVKIYYMTSALPLPARRRSAKSCYSARPVENAGCGWCSGTRAPGRFARARWSSSGTLPEPRRHGAPYPSSGRTRVWREQWPSSSRRRFPPAGTWYSRSSMPA